LIKTLRPYQQECLNKLRKRLKEITHPLLVNASVGAGKSLILSELLFIIERSNFRAICLTLNSTLIQQNAKTYNDQGGHAGIYCAGLNAKDVKESVIFGSPHSVAQGINQNQDISRQPFNLIIVDEAHNINPHDNSSMFMRILNHYGMLAQESQYSFRVVGLTGTPYRGKAISIVGKEQYFKEEVCNISSTWLIEQGYLVKPHFGLTHVEAIDFSECRVQNTGNFRHKDLEKAIHKNERLTGEIMREITAVIESGRNGAFIFAATRKHCYECARSLPEGQYAVITGETPHDERKKILEDARNGIINYIINVNCCVVGVDVPRFDVCAWLRPTESLILYTQGIGRVLRLYSGKRHAIVLDYAGNLDRHGDIDDPIINEALKPSPENEKDYVIPCYTCGTNNTVHARRCIGIVGDKRCEHFFEFKNCPSCGAANDITSRHCRGCAGELIDPNLKLSKVKNNYLLDVKSAEYWINETAWRRSPVINAKYITNDKDVFEAFFTNTEKSKNITYARFVRHHIPNPSEFYMHLQSPLKIKEMIYERQIKTPYQLTCTKDEYGKYHVIKKSFNIIE
jgi:DNA repair protein RadD